MLNEKKRKDGKFKKTEKARREGGELNKRHRGERREDKRG
jgi:hypothetical protein